MGYTLSIFAMLGIAVVFAIAFVNMTPAAIAGFIRTLGPLLLCVVGLLLTAAGRGGLGLPLLFVGATWYARNRRVGSMSSHGGGQTSTVRSAWLEMELDHHTGEMDGLVLTGKLEGSRLAGLDEATLISLYEDLSDEPDSAALMEAYLDRRIPGWRENTHANSASGQSSASGSGPMTKEEAYQILGLGPGAGPKEIRDAHRRLMKAVHPDSGGSTFLAARINQAKETLLQ